MLQGYQSYLKSTSSSLTLADLKTKALSASMKVFSTIGWMAIFTAVSWTISKVVEGIDNWIHRVEKANQAMDNAISEYESTKSSLEGINSELQEQNKRIDELLAKDKLTYAEKGELEELQKITKELLLQQDIEARRAENTAKEVADKTVDAYKTQYGKYDITKEDLNNKINQEIFPLSQSKNDITGNIAGYIRATELLTKAQQDFEQAMSNGEDTRWLSEDIQYNIDVISDYKEQLDNNLTDLVEKQLALEEVYHQDITKRDDTTLPLTTTESDTIETYELIADAIRLVYEYTNKNDWNTIEIKNILNTEGIEKTKDELIKMANAGELSPESIRSYTNLNNAISNSKIFLNDGQTAAEAFCDEIYACAKASDKLNSELENEISISDVFLLEDDKKNATLLSDLKDQLSEVESAYQTCLSAKEEYDEQGYLSVETLEKVLSLGDEYLQYLFDEEGNVRLDANAFQQLAQARINDLEAQALNNLAENIRQINNETTATEYLAQEQNNLANSYADVAANALMAMSSIDGFSNSIPLQNAYNKFKTQYEQIKGLFANTRKGLSSTYNGKTSSTKKSSSSDPLKDAFTKEYNTLKHNLEMEYITEEQYYISLEALNKKYFAGKEEYLDDYRKYEEEIYKGLKKVAQETIDSQMDYLGKKLDAGVISYQAYSANIKTIIDDMFTQGKISAEDHFSYMQKMFEKQKSIYDKVISSAVRRLVKEIQKNQDVIDSIEKQNDALEKQKDKYDKVISAVQTLIDTKKEEIQSSIDSLEKENEALNKQVSDYDSVLNVVQKVYEEKQNELRAEQDAIQERIDALRDENDEHKKAIELQKAKYELEHSMNQRSQFVFDGEQFVYQADDQSIRENQGKVSDLELEQTISNMEKEKEALQDLIDELDKYKNLWAETANAYQDIIDKEIAKNILGENYDQQILLNRIADIEAFKNRYIAAQEKIDDNTSMIASYNEKLEYYESLKRKWEDLSSAKEISTNKQIAAELLGKEWEALILEDRLTSFEEFANTYLSIQNQIDDNTSMIESYQEKIEYYESLKQQWSDLSDAYQNSVDDQYAAMLLGQNWEEQVLSGRIETLNNFKNDYISLQEAIAQATIDSYNAQVEAAKNAEAQIKSANASINKGPNITGNYGNNTGKIDHFKVIDSKTGKVYVDGLESFSEASKWISTQEANRKYPSSILTRMEVQKYEHGGVIGKKDSSPLDFIAKSVGEDHMVAVQEGEMIIPETSLLHPNNLAKMKQFESNFYRNLLDPNYNNLFGSSGSFFDKLEFKGGESQKNIEVNFGDIVLNGVQDTDTLSNKIVTDLSSKITHRLSYD